MVITKESIATAYKAKMDTAKNAATRIGGAFRAAKKSLTRKVVKGITAMLLAPFCVGLIDGFSHAPKGISAKESYGIVCRNVNYALTVPVVAVLSRDNRLMSIKEPPIACQTLVSTLAKVSGMGAMAGNELYGHVVANSDKGPVQRYLEKSFPAPAP